MKPRELVKKWTCSDKSKSQYSEGYVDGQNICADELCACLDALPVEECVDEIFLVVHCASREEWTAKCSAIIRKHLIGDEP